jgi:hypothetical protein
VNHKTNSALLINQQYNLSEDINLPDGTAVDMTIQLQDEYAKDLVVVKDTLKISGKSVMFPVKVEDLAKSNGANVSHIKRLIATHDIEHPQVSEKQNQITLPVIADIDDTYITFVDEKMSIEQFADRIYLSRDPDIIDHIMKTNPHLRRSFSQIIEGMPMVVSPYSYTHSDESYAIKQADELMDTFLQLSDEERLWFAQHHETASNALLVAASSQLDIYEGSDNSIEFSEINLNQIIAGTGAVVAGAQVQGDKISKTMKAFSEYSRATSEKTKGLFGQALYSHPAYKEWRKEARRFQKEMKSILSEVGKPGYIKRVQANKINNYLNVGKKQLYRAKDFSKAVTGIEMTALYKQSMSFSKYLGVANGLVIAAGLYGNATDVIQTCNTKGWFEETCNRSLTRNTVSAGVNVVGGVAVGFALGLAPVTGGLSIAIMAGGSFLWGLYGSEFADQAGNYIEESFFD